MFISFILLFLLGSFVLLFSGSPFYSVFGVLCTTIAHSLLLAFLGCSFFSLLFMIMYAGGMLVVFLFSTILSADRYPWFPVSFFFLFSLGVFLLLFPLLASPCYSFISSSFFGNTVNELLIYVYSPWGLVLCLTGGVLLMGLVAVLLFGFEHGLKSLRQL